MWKRGCGLWLKGQSGKTALGWATERGDGSAVELLRIAKAPNVPVSDTKYYGSRC